MNSNTCAANITTNNMIPKLRSVNKVLPRPPAHWVGDGLRVYPVFDRYAFTELLSPLLMFDYGEPRTFPPRPGQEPYGVGQHPHRGFETVTVAFQGDVEHHDSTGNSEWMTAGRGIIHEEYHSKDFTNNGGTLEMCQLWVNLPKKYKMTKPGYQEIKKDKIPVINLPIGASDDDAIGTARIIAGEIDTTKGAAKTFSPVQMWDLIIPKSGTTVDLPYPSDQNLIIFVRRGTIEVVDDNDKASKLSPQDITVMKLDGSSDHFRFRTFEKNTSVLILGGEPLNEPIAARGPFVMNTQEEIRQAMFDYQAGKMGR